MAITFTFRLSYTGCKKERYPHYTTCTNLIEKLLISEFYKYSFKHQITSSGRQCISSLSDNDPKCLSWLPLQQLGGLQLIDPSEWPQQAIFTHNVCGSSPPIVSHGHIYQCIDVRRYHRFPSGCHGFSWIFNHDQFLRLLALAILAFPSVCNVNGGHHLAWQTVHDVHSKGLKHVLGKTCKYQIHTSISPVSRTHLRVDP